MADGEVPREGWETPSPRIVVRQQQAELGRGWSLVTVGGGRKQSGYRQSKYRQSKYRQSSVAWLQSEG